MIDKVIAKKRFADTMSPFNAKSAKKWLENNNHECCDAKSKNKFCRNLFSSRIW